MPNIKVTARIVNGDQWDPLGGEATCGEVVGLICGDDLRPPPTSVTIELTTNSGKRVEVYISNSAEAAAIVRIDGETV